MVLIVTLGYMLLLVGLAIASPGIGFSGAMIACVPDSWRDGAHVPAYGLLAWLAIQGFRLRGWPLPYAMLCGTLVTILFGLWTEVAQGLAPGRETSLHDLVNDTVGGVIAATVVLGQYAWFHTSSSLKLIRVGGVRRPMKGIPSR